MRKFNSCAKNNCNSKLDRRAHIRKAHWELGEHIGNKVGEHKYKKFHHHISPLPLPKETKS
jgi:hypothetical protein